MYLIIFTGAPASGKSSIANTIAKELDIDVVSKDAYKIALYEEYGFSNHDEKKSLSLQGEQMMYDTISEYVRADKHLIVDNNFKNFGEIRRICDKSSKCKIICFNLISDSQTLADRYNARISEKNRHEALYTLDVYPIVEGVSHFHQTLKKEDVICIQRNVSEETYGDYILEIDTNHIESEFKDIIERVKKFIHSAMEE